MALEGTVHTPLGTVSKKTAVIGGAGLAVLAAIVFYRSRQSSQAKAAADAAATAGANTGIDPATGYAYGSAEDAASLGAQGDYINPSVPYAPGGGGGGGYYPPPGSGPGAFTSNSQWAQYVENQLITSEQVTDANALGNAIGKFLAGSPVTPDQVTLIQMAIAVGDKPPQQGSNGYPPSINTSNPQATLPTTSNVLKGWYVYEYLNDLNKGYPDLNLTYDRLVSLNPNVQMTNKGTAKAQFAANTTIVIR